MPACGITHLPSEIIENILGISSLADVSAFAQTCRAYRALIYDPADNHLWRTLFLGQSEFDDPRVVLGDSAIPWDALLQRWYAVSRNLCSPEPKFTPEVLEVLLEMVSYARPAARPMLLNSRNLAHVEELLMTSGFLGATNNDDIPAASRLKVYAGLGVVISVPSRRLHARSFVYDLRNYHDANSHGPFMPDGSGRVNWAHVHAIQEVIAMNLTDFVDNPQSGLPMSFRHIQAQSIPREPVAEQGDIPAEADWAGLSGKWQVVFCFCDHRDLLAFNQLNALQTTPDPSIFEDENFEEALRFLEFELRLVSVEEPATTTATTYCRGRPILHFKGSVSGNARVKGRVYMTPDEQVRWSFVSGEPNQTIWSTEAIQIGGVASAFGALGSWTTVFHDAEDPVGPMWLWKLPS